MFNLFCNIRRYKALVSLMFAALIVTAHSGCAREPQQNRACWEDRCFNIELAYTESQRERGLQQRARLADDAGMLFVFQRNEPHPFWMKDTLIPLDIIWLDQQRRVVAIQPSAPPCEADPCPTYNPLTPSSYVLEINAGLAQELGVKIGDQFHFDISG